MMKLILDWLKKNLAWLLGGLAIFIMVACFVSGCQFHKHRFPCPEPTITTHTVVITDPYWHHIADSLMNLPPKEKIKWLPQDTLYVPPDTVFKDVDTAAILKNHYSIFRYHWYKLDTGLLELNLYTTVSQNKPLKYEMDYKILKPLSVTYTTIDNSVNYSSYIYLGMGTMIQDLTMADISVYFANKQLLAGVGYIPSQKYYRASMAFKIAKFKR